MLNPASILVNTSGAIQQVSPASGSTTAIAFVSASNNTVLAANSNRARFSIYNDSSGNYLVLFSGSGISDTMFSFYLPPQTMYDSDIPTYTGPIQGRGWGSGSGNIYVTEMVP